MSEQLIIAGFHRSGTSATAQLLHRAGLFLGYELLEPLPSNPYGHFEDREVVNLHQEILADNDRTWLVGEPLLPVVSEARWARARAIVEFRNAEHALWGFKDPRACLFLMIWKYLLPDMKVLLVYRHFSESTHSLGRRHSSDLFLGMGNRQIHERFWEDPDLALRMWLEHNRILLAFARAYPEDTLAVSMDMIRDGFPFLQALEDRWNLGLEDVPLGEVYDPRIAARRTRRQPVSNPAVAEKAAEVWEELETLGRKTEATLMRGERALAGR